MTEKAKKKGNEDMHFSLSAYSLQMRPHKFEPIFIFIQIGKRFIILNHCGRATVQNFVEIMQVLEMFKISLHGHL